MSDLRSNDDPRAGAREWIGLVVMALPIFMLSTDLTVLYLAMPAISADLTPIGSQALWILHIGEFLAGAGAITFGLLALRIGPRRLLLASVAVYAMASVIAAFAVSTGMLIGARALLGVASGAFMPAVLSLVRNMFRDEYQFRQAFSIVMAAFIGGLAAGPPLGGILLEYFWWGSVFVANVPAALMLVIAGRYALPRDRPDKTVRIDPISVVLSVTMVISLVYGLQELTDSGMGLLPITSTIGGLILLMVFVRRQRRIDHPLVDLTLFDSRAFRVMVVIIAGSGMVFAATDMLLAQYLQSVRDLSSFHVGLLMMVPAAIGMLGTLLLPRLQQWLSPVVILVTSIGVAAAVSGAMFVLLPSAGLPLVVIMLSVIALAANPFTALVSQLLVTSVPAHRTGSAVAVQDVFNGLGMAGGLAAIGSLGMAIYRAILTDRAPQGLGQIEMEIAQGSVGAAADLADQFSASLGASLSDAVSSAFTAATQSGYLVAALLTVLIAIAVVYWRRLLS